MKALLLLGLLAACLVFPAAVLADDGDDEGRGARLEGTWLRFQIGDSPGPAYVATITRARGGEHNVIFSNLENPSPAGAPPGTRVTSALAIIKKATKGEHYLTSITYYGDGLYGTPHNGTVWALICSGPLVFEGPDEFSVSVSCNTSVNPCWNSWSPELCAEAGNELWNPFDDPLAFCAAAGTIRYRRMPFEGLCVPED